MEKVALNESPCAVALNFGFHQIAAFSHTPSNLIEQEIKDDKDKAGCYYSASAIHELFYSKPDTAFCFRRRTTRARDHVTKLHPYKLKIHAS